MLFYTIFATLLYGETSVLSQIIFTIFAILLYGETDVLSLILSLLYLQLVLYASLPYRSEPLHSTSAQMDDERSTVFRILIVPAVALGIIGFPLYEYVPIKLLLSFHQ